MEATPYDFESLGLKMKLPKGTMVAKDSVNNAISWMVSDERDPARWFFRIQAVVSNDPQSNTESQMKNHLQTLKTAGSEFTLLADRPTTVAGLPARFFWLSTPTGDIRAISGWFILQTGIGQFVVLSILTTEKDFAYAESAIDHAVNTIELRDMSLVQKERSDRLQRGADVIKTLTPARLKSLADGKKRLFRSWRETPEGDVELAWISIEIAAAPRGSADPAANPKAYSESAKEQGFLLSIDSRSIGEDGLTLTSSRNRYWVAWDLGSEVWSVRSIPQIPGPKNIFSQTGARFRGADGAAGNDLAVLTNSVGATAEPESWTVPNNAYLPHPLSFMMAELLPRDATAAGRYSMWCFDPGSGKISQRTLKWQADDSHPGQWTLDTQTSLDGPVSTDQVDEHGRLILRNDPSGTRMAPTTLSEIERLWKAKGLQP
ncbi:MAG: hypothetical protein K8R92_01320 [Planctomycetes bacterium]|nr:hypothetical protein [Planctomycetota bacterium]